MKRVSHKAKISIFTAFAIWFFGLYLLISPARVGRLFVVFTDPLVYYYLTFLLVPLTVIGLYWRLKTVQERELVVLSLFSLGVFLAGASSGRDYTVMLVVSPFFLPLCLTIIQVLHTKFSKQGIGLAVLIVYVLPFFLFGVKTLAFVRQFDTTIHDNKEVTAIKVPQAEARELETVIPYIQAHVPATSKIMCFPYCPLLFVLSERGSASYFSFFYPETFQVSDQNTVIHDFMRNKPTMIILQRKGTIEPFANYEDKRLSVLRSYFLSHAHLVKETANFAIYTVNRW